jgi:malonyl-CoA/methylmalonyl-CoA synthetase
MRGGWFHTGDLGRIRREDGYLEILGRAKDLIITGGYNVYPAEVEAVLQSMAGVDEAAVVGKPSAEYGETVHAFIVSKPGFRLDPEALMAEAAKHLAKYKVPRSIDLVKSLPRNAMGKVQKQVLREGLK